MIKYYTNKWYKSWLNGMPEEIQQRSMIPEDAMNEGRWMVQTVDYI